MTRTVLVTLELSEIEALERDISQVESLLQEHNARTRQGAAQLLFRQISTADSGCYRHLEVSRWQGYVRASVDAIPVQSAELICLNLQAVV